MAGKGRADKAGKKERRAQDAKLLASILGDADSAGETHTAWAGRADAIERELSARTSPTLSALSPDDRTAMLCWAAGNGRTALVRALLLAKVDPNAMIALDLPSFDPYEERERTPAELLQMDAGMEQGEAGTVKLRAICPAVRKNQLEVCKVLLEAGADANADAGTGAPILDAVGHGHAPIVRILIEHGAKTDVKGGARTLLHMAAAYKHAEVTRVLLTAGMDPNVVDSTGDGPLEAAAWSGDIESARQLIEAGAEVNPPDPTPETISDPMLRGMRERGKLNFSTPLIAAAQLGHVEIVRLLLKAGANLSRKNNLGKTAYDVARERKKPEVVKVLREAGADRATGATVGPLDLLTAADGGDLDGIRAALDAGVPVDAQVSGPGIDDLFKKVASATKSHPQGIVGVMAQLIGGAGKVSDPALAQALRAPQPAVKVPREFMGMTALMLAARNGHVDAVRYLISRGANVMARAGEAFNGGQTALFFAARFGHVPVMKLLVEAGADVNAAGLSAAGEPTDTPLHVAARRGNDEAIRFLLDHGARTDIRAFDLTPLDEARQSRREGAIRLLEGR